MTGPVKFMGVTLALAMATIGAVASNVSIHKPTNVQTVPVSQVHDDVCDGEHFNICQPNVEIYVPQCNQTSKGNVSAAADCLDFFFGKNSTGYCCYCIWAYSTSHDYSVITKAVAPHGTCKGAQNQTCTPILEDWNNDGKWVIGGYNSFPDNAEGCLVQCQARTWCRSWAFIASWQTPQCMLKSTVGTMQYESGSYTGNCTMMAQ